MLATKRLSQSKFDCVEWPEEEVEVGGGVPGYSCKHWRKTKEKHLLQHG